MITLTFENFVQHADKEVKKLISGIYDRIDKEADAEGKRFESDWKDSSASVP